jgi:esterase/lipase superfamily enzyme
LSLQVNKVDTGKSFLVFIHGFNNGFKEDIYKTAQLAHDTRFSGVPIMFDWPATTRTINLVAGYITDLKETGNSKANLAEFLVELARTSPGATINIVAHSMGNRLLLEALDKLRDQKRLPLLGQIILAAPDVDPTRFHEVMDPLLKERKIARVTLYGSKKDWAMAVSKQANSEYPVGRFPPVTTVLGVDKIDVSELHMNIIGHDYFITTQSVLNDIAVLLRHGSAPPRPGLRFVGTIKLPSWELTDASH